MKLKNFSYRCCFFFTLFSWKRFFYLDRRKGIRAENLGAQKSERKKSTRRDRRENVFYRRERDLKVNESSDKRRRAGKKGQKASRKLLGEKKFIKFIRTQASEAREESEKFVNNFLRRYRSRGFLQVGLEVTVDRYQSITRRKKRLQVKQWTAEDEEEAKVTKKSN